MVTSTVAPTPGRTRLRGFIRLARLRFLLYNVLPVGLAVAVTVHQGHPFHPGWYVLAQLFAWTVHLMTHYCNEYFDLEADRANESFTPWTGGSRALVDGSVAPIVSLGTSFLLAGLAALMVAVMPTWEARLLATAAVILAWFYTAPPLAFNYRATGELTVAAILNGLWPAVAAALQTGGDVPPLLLLVLAPTALLQVVRMMVMNLGDRRSDEAVGKRTLVVVLGYRTAVRVIVTAQPVAYAMLTVFALVGWIPWLVWLPMAATGVLSGWLVVQLRASAMRDLDAVRMTPVVFWASNHVSLIVAAAMLGVLLDAASRGADPTAVAVLSAVLLAYAALFAHRLWQSRRLA
ncbi:1,4-dihydroxy-2-naphthoate octaprenyltransferase [Catenuloplanes nepalensis]|uniref:1,4-dihydroxy-2-naphthoate octaprenyltransferase n=1 Tax=Catenuloplanes nepalensis TaxID=587533 RepID=A0ABT9MLX6_9ACTN|nr:prenyltransferase [Catenuloplanes nepalensis]MDP9792394.1 1,4-dihydroxy-2-naphthoate octaprenyltransferase [Catenuloplanes nepalensis]